MLCFARQFRILPCRIYVFLKVLYKFLFFFSVYAEFGQIIANALDAAESLEGVHVKLDDAPNKEAHETPNFNDYRGKLKST